jgi:hypothetical protein
MPTGKSWLVALGLLGCCTQAAQAQLLMSLFPEGVPGYGTEQGVTVQSRSRPDYDPLGLHAGTWTIRPLLNESFGYDNNLFGAPSHRGSWEIVTAPSVQMSTEGSTGSAGLFFSGNDTRYLGQPSQNRTDGKVFLGGTLDLGRDKLTAGAGYLSQYEDRTALDALPSDRPVAFMVENLRLSYAADFAPFTLTPAIDLNRWRFDNTTILGVPVSQAPRDRTTGQAGLTIRYEWMSGRNLLLVTRFEDTHYDHPVAGAPSNNSTAWQTLAGIDYDNDSVWRYRLLGGIEYRQFAASGVGSETTPIVEVEVTWLPSGQTTVRATATREVEDAAQTGLSTFTYTSAQLTIDHEFLRNLLLNASAAARYASFYQTGGRQLGLSVGVGATWLINRTLRLSLASDFTDLRNAHLPASSVAGDYTRTLTMLTLRAGL